MSLPVTLRDSAVVEFDEQRQQGLGLQFAAEIGRVLGRIAQAPSSAPVAVSDVRKAAVSRFPFCVFYRIQTDRIDVLAIFHTSRNPQLWQERA